MASTPPWERPSPKKRHTKLTAKSKRAVRARARRAGRTYPNLVDNMNAAKRQPRGGGAKARERTTKTSEAHDRGRERARVSGHARRKPPLKDPHGGLTAAGRKAFAQKEGAHLRPGVKKSMREMTPAEMRRKGSWAVRFYGRSGKLPPLVDADGEPTRFAKTAAAWGEPVPTTVAAARRIAAKGRRLLAKYRAHAGR